MKSELYCSFDVETNGPCPGVNALLSFGCAAIRENEIVGTFTRNLHLEEGTGEDLDTRDFWLQNQKAYNATRENLYYPVEAFIALSKWVREIRTPDEIPVFVAYPAGFDFSWMYYYGMKYTPKSLPNCWPFGFSCIDIKTKASDALGKLYTYSVKRNWPKSWTSHTLTHTHLALDDAIEQAKSFIEIQKTLTEMKRRAQTY